MCFLVYLISLSTFLALGTGFACLGVLLFYFSSEISFQNLRTSNLDDISTAEIVFVCGIKSPLSVVVSHTRWGFNVLDWDCEYFWVVAVMV